MTFVYLRDGERIEIDDGFSFVLRAGSLLCLDRQGIELRRFDARDVTAYGHIAYPYSPDFVSRPLDAEEREAFPPLRKRRRRSYAT